MVVADRIRELAYDKGMNIKEFSAFINVSERTIQNYLAGISLPNGRFLTDLCEKIGVSATWILVGVGPKYVHGNHQNFQCEAGGFTPIPRYTVEASAGHGAVCDDENSMDFLAVKKSWLVQRGLSADMLAIIKVKGNSMEPDLKDGDLILIDRARTEAGSMDEGGIYVVRFDSDLFIKRVQHLPGSRLMLVSSNPVYHPVTVEPADLGGVKIIGRVIYSAHEW